MEQPEVEQAFLQVKRLVQVAWPRSNDRVYSHYDTKAKNIQALVRQRMQGKEETVCKRSPTILPVYVKARRQSN